MSNNMFYIVGYWKSQEVFISATLIKGTVDYLDVEDHLTDDLLLSKSDADVVLAFCLTSKKSCLKYVHHLAIEENFDGDLLTMAEHDKHDDIATGYDDHGQVKYEDGEQVDEGDDYLDDRDEDELV